MSINGKRFLADIFSSVVLKHVVEDWNEEVEIERVGEAGAESEGDEVGYRERQQEDSVFVAEDALDTKDGNKDDEDNADDAEFQEEFGVFALDVEAWNIHAGVFDHLSGFGVIDKAWVDIVLIDGVAAAADADAEEEVVRAGCGKRD